MSRSTSPYTRTSGGGATTPQGSASAALLPLEDAPSDLLRDPLNRGAAPGRGAYGGLASSSVSGPAPASASPSPTSVPAAAAPPVVTSASADFQRSLVQQQLQQSQRDVRKLKEELYDASGRLGQVTTKLNEQRVEYGALTHRYAAAIEKLTSAEGDVKKLEEQLVQERTRSNRIREDGEEAKAQLRATNEDCARLQRELAERDANRGLDRREVQRLLEDRTQYLPAVEVRRMQAEVRDSQQMLVDRLTRALDGLLGSAEEEETNTFVSRSAVLSSATDLDARVLRAEAVLDRLAANVRGYQEGLEAETNDFLLALMAENKELWRHLTQLQADHDVALSELALLSRKGESVPVDQHQYVQRQLENMSDRLDKARQVMAAQTALAREHEAEMQELLRNNAELEETVKQLTKRLASEEAAGKGKSTALDEADAALKDATQQIRSLQEALVAERASADDTVKRLTETHNTMQTEFEQRLRAVQGERAGLEEKLDSTAAALNEAQAGISALERDLSARSAAFDAYRQKTEEAMCRQQMSTEADMTQAQQAMERELGAVHARLEEAQQEARAAVRERDDTRAESQTLRATVTTLEAELSRQRTDADHTQRQLADVQERLRGALAEKDELSQRCGATGMTAKELESRIARLVHERAELAQQLKDETQRWQQRYEAGQRDWHGSEKARANLQDELKLLRTRVAEMETARLSHERHLQDREHLMKENLRLHEQYTVIQQENTRLASELKSYKTKNQSSIQLAQQLQDLQQRLRELPHLRQSADDARREALKAREETEVLRKERDDMAAKLDYFLEESKAAAQMDEAFDRVVRDAGEAVRRLGGQVHSAKARGAPATTTTTATPEAFVRGDGNASTRSPYRREHAAAAAAASPLSSPPSGLSAAAGQRMSGVSTDVGVLTREAAALDASSRNTPQRPWKA